MDFEEFCRACDRALVLGRVSEVRRKLLKVALKDVPSMRRVEMAALCRRADLPEVSLNLLKTCIYPASGRPRGPSDPRALVEYALSLQLVGSFRESENLLAPFAAVGEPRIAIARAFYEIHHWNYSAAIGYLESALKSEKLTDYERLVCRVNLLSCLAEDRHPSFGKAREELEDTLKRQQKSLLLANVLEISAQYSIEVKEWAAAEEALNRAQVLVDGAGSFAQGYLSKWRSILRALSTGSKEPLLAERTKSLRLRDWETLRHLDYYQTVLEPDGHWGPWVYFGTPFPSFRQKLSRVRAFPEQDWIYREQGSGDRRVDPWFLEVGDAGVSHRLMVHLLSDFYRPFKVGEIGSEVFDVKKFDVRSTPNRVHQAMHRLRAWLKEGDLPFDLAEQGGQYSLRLKKGARLLARARGVPLSRLGFIFGRCRDVAKEPLEMSAWGRLLRAGKARTRALVYAACDEGVLKKTGSGRYTQYALKEC